MNANEVIASLAGDGVHPNDHVNMGQSSNDVFPSAVHLAALDRIVAGLLPALEQLEASLAAKAREFDDVVKSGRTHLMDAVPVRLGQEFAGYAARCGKGLPACGTCTATRRDPARRNGAGTGLNTHPDFAAGCAPTSMRYRPARFAPAETRSRRRPPATPLSRPPARSSSPSR